MRQPLTMQQKHWFTLLHICRRAVWPFLLLVAILLGMSGWGWIGGKVHDLLTPTADERKPIKVQFRGPHRSSTAADQERDVHTLVNQYRTGQGLPPLTFRPDIATIARQHSRDMALGRVGVGHSGADRRADQMAQSVPTTQGFAENVAFNTRSGQAAGQMAVDGWIHSPAHRRNMEGAFDLTGIGIVQGPRGISFFTQLFVKTPAYRPGTAGNETVRSVPREETRRPARRPRDEKDPRQRPGRKRTSRGWKQKLD